MRIFRQDSKPSQVPSKWASIPRQPLLSSSSRSHQCLPTSRLEAAPRRNHLLWRKTLVCLTKIILSLKWMMAAYTWTKTVYKSSDAQLMVNKVVAMGTPSLREEMDSFVTQMEGHPRVNNRPWQLTWLKMRVTTKSLIRLFQDCKNYRQVPLGRIRRFFCVVKWQILLRLSLAHAISRTSSSLNRRHRW